MDVIDMRDKTSTLEPHIKYTTVFDSVTTKDINTMRDYSIFDQLSDKELEGIVAATRNYIDSDQRGYFGFVSSETIAYTATEVVTTICKILANRGLAACQGHNYKENKEDK